MSYDLGTAGTFPLGAHAVGRIGFGAMRLERLVERPAEAAALLRQVVDLGVDHIDTSQATRSSTSTTSWR